MPTPHEWTERAKEVLAREETKRPIDFARCPICDNMAVVRIPNDWQEQERAIPIIACGSPWHYATRSLGDSPAESAAPQPLDVNRLARAWFVGIQARSGINRDTALRRWNATSDPDVEYLHNVYGDVAAKAAAEYARA